MTIKTSAVRGRRVLRFESLDELQQEAERVASSVMVTEFTRDGERALAMKVAGSSL